MQKVRHQLWLNIRLFGEGAVLSYIGMFHWLRPTMYVSSKIIGPVWQIMFFTYLGIYATGRDTADFYIIGNAMQLVGINGIYGVTMSISGDRHNGTLPYLFAAPANRVVMFLGRAAVHILDGMLGVLIGLAWGIAVLGLDLTQANPLALMLIILTVAFSTSGLGLLMGSLSLITVNVMFVNNLLYYLMLVFCGVNIPVENLPGWMQPVSQMMPLTHGLDAARRVINGANPESVFPLLAVEVGLGLLYGLLGFGVFRWIEYQARRRATLDAV